MLTQSDIMSTLWTDWGVYKHLFHTKTSLLPKMSTSSPWAQPIHCSMGPLSPSPANSCLSILFQPHHQSHSKNALLLLSNSCFLTGQSVAKVRQLLSLSCLLVRRLIKMSWSFRRHPVRGKVQGHRLGQPGHHWYEGRGVGRSRCNWTSKLPENDK